MASATEAEIREKIRIDRSATKVLATSPGTDDILVLAIKELADIAERLAENLPQADDAVDR